MLFVHAAGEALNVEVRGDDGSLIARGTHLKRTANTPMARLRRQGDTITREDTWPTEADYGLPVILAGGEVGILQRWWNDPGSWSGAGAWNSTTIGSLCTGSISVQRPWLAFTLRCR